MNRKPSEATKLGESIISLSLSLYAATAILIVCYKNQIKSLLSKTSFLSNFKISDPVMRIMLFIINSLAWAARHTEL